jgi:hypothetical protein
MKMGNSPWVKSAAWDAPPGEKEQPHPYDRDGASAIRPLNLPGHKAPRQHVDPLQDPDSPHADEQDGKNSERDSHTFPFSFQGESYRKPAGWFQNSNQAAQFRPESR